MTTTVRLGLEIRFVKGAAWRVTHMVVHGEAQVRKIR